MKKIILYFLCISCLFIGRSFGQSSEKKGWPSVDRYSFISECIKKAKVGRGEDTARSYCYCMQLKIEAKFPTIEEAAKLSANDLETIEWKNEINNCLGYATWDSAFRAGFMSDCISEAKKNISEEKAKTYCECMVFKVESKYPRMADAGNLTAETLKSAEWKKAIKDCLDF